jgi:tetratricopeptide (TPR) repeat protein
MRLTQLDGSWRAVILVGIVLLLAIVLTGAASSAYRRERVALGAEHYAFARQLAVKGDAEGAAEEYRRALFYSPANAEYRLSLAMALIQAGRLDEAESHLEQLADDEPSNPRVYVGLAEIAAREHRTTAAITNFQRGVYEYWPPEQIWMRRAARWELVNLLISHHRRSEAIGELMQLYGSAPNEPKDRERIGFALLQLGAGSEASRIFSELTRVFPQDAAAWRGQAEVAAVFGDYVAARHYFQHALRLEPNDHDSNAQLQVINAAIDVTPGLPNISNSERLRRSGNLLRRVLKELGNCTGGAEFSQEVEAAEALFSKRPKSDEDLSLEMQQAAQDLWKQRAAVCGEPSPSDKVIEMAMARNMNE